MTDSERRRRRLRHHPAAGPGGPAAGPGGRAGEGRPPGDAGPVPDGRSAPAHEVLDPVPDRAGSRRGPDPGLAPEDRDGERGLRGLIGSGASQVSVGAAMRARDAARPTDADLAEAAERLVLVRRNWVPREDLPRNGR